MEGFLNKINFYCVFIYLGGIRKMNLHYVFSLVRKLR